MPSEQPKVEGPGHVIAAALREDLRVNGGVPDAGAWWKEECADCGCYVRSLREHECPRAPR